jgi:hypothetical protein
VIVDANLNSQQPKSALQAMPQAAGDYVDCLN